MDFFISNAYAQDAAATGGLMSFPAADRNFRSVLFHADSSADETLQGAP